MLKLQTVPAYFGFIICCSVVALGLPTVASSDEGAAAAEFQLIQKEFGGGAYEEALKEIGTFLKAHPEEPHGSAARNLQGLIFLLTKRTAQSIAPFKRAIETSQNDSFKQFVRYNLATAYFEGGQVQEAKLTLSELKPELLDKDNRIKFLILRARLGLRVDDALGSVADYLELGRRLETEEGRSPFTSPLTQALSLVHDAKALEPIYRENTDSPWADLLLYRMGELAFKGGQFSSAENYLKKVVSDFPRSSDLIKAKEILAAIQDQSTADPKLVGVLLPMTGKFSKFGQRGLQAISLAFGIFGSDKQKNSKVNLIIEDTGEDPETAMKALDRLYFQHHVGSVIGPLLSKGVEALTQKANEIGLPMITLSQNSGSPGESVFSAGLTPKLQAHEIARYAIEKRGLKKFAILYPRDKFGEQFSQAFWDAIDELGGEVVGIESYLAGETDFRQPIDKLSGLYYTEARSKEIEALAEQRRELKITKKTRKTEQYFNLKPIVDYDAVFIPDEPKVVGQILPTFAYRDVTGIQFLGISTWNSPELTSRAQSFANGALFSEAFSSTSSSKTAQKFESNYREAFNQEPASMEALAFDAAAVLESAIQSGAKNRSELRNYLKGVTNFPGATGKITQKDGHFGRDVAILTVKSGQIIEASQEPLHEAPKAH